MRRFFDIKPRHWYYNDVIDIESILLDDDIPFVTGYPFNAFEEGHERIDHMISVIVNTNEIVVPEVMTHTADDPVTVFVDGMLSIIEEVTPDLAAGETLIRLRRVVPQGSVVRVLQQGKPAVTGDRNTPTGVVNEFEYPRLKLNIPAGSTYKYNPFSANALEVARYRGSQLKRVDYSTDINDNFLFFKGHDEYTVSPDGFIYVPFGLNNEEIELSYAVEDEGGIERSRYIRGIAMSDSLVYFGFFPQAVISRAEFFTFLNNIRLYLTRRLADDDPWRSNSETSRFSDVNTDAWYWQHVRDLEQLRLPDGRYIVNGMPNGTLMPNSIVTRAEIITLLDLFRVWFIEAFK